jgi:hypothetical protein
MARFKKGDKLIAFQKTVGCDLRNVIEHDHKGIVMYFHSYIPGGNVHADTRNGGDGWTFHEEDLIPWSANEEAYWKMKLHLL